MQGCVHLAPTAPTGRGAGRLVVQPNNVAGGGPRKSTGDARQGMGALCMGGAGNRGLLPSNPGGGSKGPKARCRGEWGPRLGRPRPFTWGKRQCQRLVRCGAQTIVSVRLGFQCWEPASQGRVGRVESVCVGNVRGHQCRSWPAAGWGCVFGACSTIPCLSQWGVRCPGACWDAWLAWGLSQAGVLPGLLGWGLVGGAVHASMWGRARGVVTGELKVFVCVQGIAVLYHATCQMWQQAVCAGCVCMWQCRQVGKRQ